MTPQAATATTNAAKLQRKTRFPKGSSREKYSAIAPSPSRRVVRVTPRAIAPLVDSASPMALTGPWSQSERRLRRQAAPSSAVPITGSPRTPGEQPRSRTLNVGACGLDRNCDCAAIPLVESLEEVDGDVGDLDYRPV